MYRKYFGLGEAPFSIAPDPRYLYMSERHQEALAHLRYGINGDGGFVLLTGEVGAGKTTICRCLLEQIPPNCDIAYIFNPKLTVEELLSTICTELGVAYPAGRTSVKTFVDNINAYLLDAHARGRHAVLIIDEAQSLSVDVLEQMRLLTNLETNQRKLLQIILVGQPELAEMLARPELRQLAQRIVARYHLGPLAKSEVAAYVRHRLEIAGAQQPLFPPSLAGRLFSLSHGVPRLINVLCDRALLGAYVQGRERVDRTTLTQAAREVFFQPVSHRRRLLDFFSIRTNPPQVTAPELPVHHPAPLDKQTALQPHMVNSAGGAGLAALAVTAPNAESSAPLTDDAEWLTVNPRVRSKAVAYAALFRAWGAAYRQADPGSQAAQLGLRCHAARGGLDELRDLNRPAILRLRDRKGREFYATLTALDDNTATFDVGVSSQSITTRTLATQWTSDYTMLWRLPPSVRENIWPGERGPAVQWLHRQLALAQGTAEVTAEDQVFDDVMVSHVKTFQRAHGLIPNGDIGLQTLMRLTSLTDPTAPSLIRPQVKD